MKFKSTFTLLTLLLLAFLVACGGQAAPAAVDTAPAAAGSLDLADTVDVQTVSQIKDRSDVVVLDVREQWEYDEQHIPGVTLIPMGEVPNRLSEIPTDKTVIVTCRSGNRSGQVTDYLRQAGYTDVHNMAGGILAWQQAGYSVEP
ncbi:MAG: rhodanese-like domain-containing protein [Anaerolineales bacterium]|nr:rhodanese-like domain-containing protein [Anaerolineales bacterium]MCB8952705.1 rhodanese-like domain-containing protein [Ardenticatenales bacterium]